MEYKIFIDVFDAFEAKVEKLNHKADKLGVEPIKYDIVGKGVEKINNFDYPYHIVKLHNSSCIKYEGYTFRGKLERGVDNTFFYFGDNSVPISRVKVTTCEHCKTNRRRKFYYILQAEDGTYITVGKSCLKDFVGHTNVDKVALHYSNILALNNFSIEYTGEPTMEYNYRHYDLDFILRLSIASIKSIGYKPTTEDELSISTKTHVYQIITLRDKNKSFDKLYNYAVDLPQSKIDEIKNVILEDTQDTHFMNNLKQLVNCGYLSYKHLGLACCIPRVVERIKSKSTEASIVSEYLGTIGEKLTVDITYIGRSSFDGMYGLVYFYNFIDKDGRKIVWKTSSIKPLHHDEVYKATFTIAEHSEYRGIKQTRINRPKFNIKPSEGKYLKFKGKIIESLDTLTLKDELCVYESELIISKIDNILVDDFVDMMNTYKLLNVTRRNILDVIGESNTYNIVGTGKNKRIIRKGE